MKPARLRAVCGAAAFLAAALLCTAHAEAATGLAIVCPNAAEAGKQVQTSCGASQQGQQVYKTPVGADLVRVDPGRAAGDRANWDPANTAYTWKPWDTVAPGELVETCKTNLADPSAFDDPANVCGDWAFAPKVAPAASIFLASPLTGRAPLTVLVTWNITNGSQCKAGGGWTGDKAAAGSESIILAGPSSLALTCTVPGAPGPGKAVLTWIAPTQNTDGTAYTNAKGYFIYRGTSSPPTAKSALVPVATLTQTFTGIAPNSMQYFGLTAVNANDIESDMLQASKLVEGLPTTSTYSAPPIAIDVQAAMSKPRSPVLTVE